MVAAFFRRFGEGSRVGRGGGGASGARVGASVGALVGHSCPTSEQQLQPLPWGAPQPSLPRYLRRRRGDPREAGRGDAAAAARIVCRRVAATPRPRDVDPPWTGLGDAAAAT